MSNQKTDKTIPRIFIDKNGNWFQDGIPVLHRWTYLYNNRLLRRDEEGRYYLDEGRGKVYAHVEDTPFVVKMIDKREDGIYLILNDETEEKLDFRTLMLNKENIPYTKVKGGTFDARFNRPAYYEITKYLKEESGKYYLELGEKKYHVKSKKIINIPQ
ncbi:MAG TPA: hypothetical protein VGA95_11520 [Thermodesulfobacteriota bacterium]|jgi:hypothetical protein